MENKSERWKVIRFDLMAKILYDLLFTNSRSQIEGTVMGWQFPVLHKIANDPKLIFNNTRTSSVQDGLRN